MKLIQKYTKVFTGIAAGIYDFRITDGTWTNSWGFEGGQANMQVDVEVDESDVTITFDLKTKLTTAFVTAGATPSEASSEIEVTEPSFETEPSSETEPQPTEPTCAHSNTTKTGKKTATYFAKGYTGDIVCADCGEVVVKGSSVAKKVLKTPIKNYKST